jgi:hypothetical protein
MIVSQAAVDGIPGFWLNLLFRIGKASLKD